MRLITTRRRFARFCYYCPVKRRPTRSPKQPDSAVAGPEWVSRRLLCVLLLVFSATIAGAFWVEIVTNTLDRPDTASGPAVEPEFFKYAGGHNFDFYQYYAAGHNWSLGANPYENHPDDPRVLPHPRHEDKAISGWIYPPTWLPVFGLLADLPYSDARHVWFGVTLALLAGSIAVAVAVTPGRRLELATAAVLLTICSYPLLYHVHQGQVDLVVAGLSVSAFLLYPRWRGWPSAALVAAAILLKVTPVLLLAVVVLYYRDIRFLLKTLVCLVAGLAVSLLVVSPGLYWEYAVNTLPRISATDPDRDNQTLVRFWSAFPVMSKAVSVLGYLALLFLAYVSGRNGARAPAASRFVDRQTESRAVLLLAILMTLMFSPLAWQMAYAMIIVPVAALLVAPPPRLTLWAPVAIAIGAALMSSKIYNVQVLNLLNVLGAGIAVLSLLCWYLPLRVDKAGTRGETYIA